MGGHVLGCRGADANSGPATRRSLAASTKVRPEWITNPSGNGAATIHAVPDSPIVAALKAIDALDADALTSLFAENGRLLTVDGRVAEGIEQVRAVAASFVAELRATSHQVTFEWNPEPGVWIAELDSTYELNSLVELGPYPRAIILRDGPSGIVEMRIYGLHEQPLTASAHPYQEVFGSGHWLPTL